jgi:hypothetical protein
MKKRFHEEEEDFKEEEGLEWKKEKKGLHN